MFKDKLEERQALNKLISLICIQLTQINEKKNNNPIDVERQTQES